MRILANESFPEEAVAALRERQHDVAWIRTDAPGCSDREVIERARVDRRLIITFDKDFGELAFRSKSPATCGIVLFRIAAPSAATWLAPLSQPWKAGPIGLAASLWWKSIASV